MGVSDDSVALIPDGGGPESSTSTAHMATTTLRVEGMTCGACSASIESAFRGVDGVGTVSVSLVMGRAVVVHDPTRISAEQVKDVIEDRGFDAEVLLTDLTDEEDLPGSRTSTTTLAVEGMTCGACTSAIESAFKDVAGLAKFNVSLMSERAVVEHDAAVLSPAQIAEMIEDRGFGASIISTEVSKVARSSSKKRDGRRAPELATTTVAVEGMTCGACTSAVEKGFQGVDGLFQFSISLLAERVVLVHHPTRLPVKKIVDL